MNLIKQLDIIYYFFNPNKNFVMLKISICKGWIFALLDELEEIESSNTKTEAGENNSSCNGKNVLSLLYNLILTYMYI